MSLEIRELSEAELIEMMAEHRRLNPDRPIREDIKEALDCYAKTGGPLGGFLTAVVENNLMEALGRADSYNRATIYQICQYIYNELPSNCHGSPEAVREWRKQFEMEAK
jgi:hypothetical protein